MVYKHNKSQYGSGESGTCFLSRQTNLRDSPIAANMLVTISYLQNFFSCPLDGSETACRMQAT